MSEADKLEIVRGWLLDRRPAEGTHWRVKEIYHMPAACCNPLEVTASSQLGNRAERRFERFSAFGENAHY